MGGRRALVICFLGILLNSGCVQGYSAAFSAPVAGKAAGSVLVLDVSSLWKKHPTQPQISTPDAEACQKRCADLPGCTGFAFCKAKDGCGSGCAAHAAKHKAVSAVALESANVPNKRGEKVEVAGAFTLPILAFGPYSPNAASGGCDSRAPDKWAWGTCTLLAAAGGGKTAPAGEGAGWVSAWLAKPVPPQCGRLSAAACAACHSSPDAASCLSCSTDKRSATFVVDVALIADGVQDDSVGSRLLDQCLSCSKLTSKEEQKQCATCVLDGAACGGCVPYPGAATQLPLGALGPCMSCMEARGKRFAGACLTCAASPDPSKCVGCLQNYYPALTCRSTSTEGCYKPEWDNPCATCQKVTPSAYGACTACYSSPGRKADCDSCALAPSGPAQAQCFACSARNAAGGSGGGNGSSSSGGQGGGCGGCFARSKSPAALTQCLACAGGDAAVPAAARQHCSLCASPELGDAASGRCFKCLAGKAGGPWCAACAGSASSDGAFGACAACRADPAAGPDCRDCESLGYGSSPAEADALRKRCYECVAASKLVVPPDAGSAPLGSCQACLSVRGADAAACVACNTNAGVPSLAKGWCVSCASKAPGPAREACMACLAAKGNAKLTSAAAFQAACKI